MNRRVLPTNVTIPTVYECPDYWIVDKPAGTPSQPDVHQVPCVSDIIKRQLNVNYIGLVHRLDRNTSGLMCLAKTKVAAASLTKLLQQGKIKRSYIAWVFGPVPDELNNRAFTHFLWKNPKNNKTTVFKKPTQGALEATLQLKLLKEVSIDNQVLSLVEFNLETGRSHQIRAQAQAIGIPIAGDLKYNKISTPLQFKRVLLHSHFIKIEGTFPAEIQSKIPDDFYLKEYIKNLVFP